MARIKKSRWEASEEEENWRTAEKESMQEGYRMAAREPRETGESYARGETSRREGMGGNGREIGGYVRVWESMRGYAGV
eukprot:1346023-Amorphochlora_amoeboformis.AAC.1